jgi:integrase
MVRFLLLSAARRNEAAEMTWAELDGAEWTLPAERNKTKVDLLRPLSGAAMAILAEQKLAQAGGPFVFRKGSLSDLKRAFDWACGVSGWTFHDLRRTARSLMSRAGIPSDHAERCLGHVIGGVRGVHDRHEYLEEKRRAFEALASQVDRIVNPPAANVVAIRGQQ